MNLFFAYWILAAAATLGAGENQPFPAMVGWRTAPPAITDASAAVEVVVGEGQPCPGDPNCFIPPTREIRLQQSFCVQPGVYQVHLRLGLMPGPAGGGRIWLHGPDGILHLLNYQAAPDAWPTYSTSTAIAADSAGCWTLRFDGWGAATVNPDPRVTRITIHRAGP